MVRQLAFFENKEKTDSNIFLQYVEQPGIFRNKEALSATFTPGKIQHRDEEITQMSNILAPILKGYRPSNILVYGTCGTGKTICSRYVIGQLEEAAKKVGAGVRPVYLNCKMKKIADTEYRIFAQLLKELGETVPDTGLPTDVVYRRFFEVADKEKQVILIVLDEIDAIFKKIGDEFLYNLTRANTELERARISIVGITNDLSFRDGLDLRVKSSLSDEEILFKPYNAEQLRHILEERAKEGFSAEISPSVLNKCAAIAAQEHGDARRALDLLRVAGEMAERLGSPLAEEHVDVAERKIDTDRIAETVHAQPKQSQAVLHAIIKLNDARQKNGQWSDRRLLTGDVFSLYQDVCRANGMKQLTQRRISDLIGELDMLGIISARVISKGRYGRTREINVLASEASLGRIRQLLTSRFS